MKTYTNIFNQALSFSLSGEGAGDHVIAPGESAELPASNAHVQALVGLGHLKEKEVEVKTIKKDK